MFEAGVNFQASSRSARTLVRLVLLLLASSRFELFAEPAPAGLRDGWYLLDETASPDRKYAVIAPDWDHYNNDATGQNELVKMGTWERLAVLATPCWVAEHGKVRHAVRRDLVSVWTADRSTLLWMIQDKWGPVAFSAVRLKNDTVEWQTDLLKLLQTEILNRTRDALPINYATAVRENGRNGSAFPQGFAISISEPAAGSTFPLVFTVELTSNPKELDSLPVEAEVRAKLKASVAERGTVTYSEFQASGGAQARGGGTAMAEERTPEPPKATPAPTVATRSAMPGERFPETRSRAMRPEDVAGWDAAKLRYAINEIYARHGGTFREKEIQQWFSKFAWYHPQPALSMAVIEGSFTPIEAENMKVLGAARDALKAGKK